MPAVVVLGTPLVLAWPVVVPVVVEVEALPVLDPPVVLVVAVVKPPVVVEVPVLTPGESQVIVPLQLQPQVLQSAAQLVRTPLFTPAGSPGQEQDPPWTQTTQPEQLAGASEQAPEVMSQHWVPLKIRLRLPQQSPPKFLL